MHAGAIGRWFERHDPERYALHRAVRLTIVAVIVLVIAQRLIGNTLVVTFGVFGTFALLLFADFPGNRSARAGSYAMLWFVGCLLIVIGTALSQVWWQATLGMAVFGFLIWYVGALSAALAAAGRAALLAFILPVLVPGSLSDLLPRLGGWTLAAALSVPAALFLWPPRHHDRLRATAAASCRTLAARFTPGRPDAGRPTAETDIRTALAAMGQARRNTAYRPVSLTTGSRLVLRATDELDWVAQVTDPSREPERDWPAWTQPVIAAAARVLDLCAAALGREQGRLSAGLRAELRDALEVLTRERADAARRLGAALTGTGSGAGRTAQRPDPVEPSDPVAGHRIHRVHAWAHVVAVVGRTVAAAAEADTRPLLARLFGRGSGAVEVPPMLDIRDLAIEQAHRNSVWLQHSIRVGGGLAAAVAVAQLSHVQHGFWVGLGAMSVLRTSAVLTTSTVFRAIVGTTVGFLIGGGLMVLVGTGPAALWVLLPLCILIAGFAPQTVSFAAGQAAFTVAVVVLFNLLQPVGWRVGLVRIEDVALGGAAALVVGIICWPGGAAAQVRRALADAYRAASGLFAGTVRSVVDGWGPAGTARAAPDGSVGAAAALRLDAAVRQFVAERSIRPERLELVTTVAGGVNRLRLAADSLAEVFANPQADGGQAAALRSGEAERVLDERAVRLDAWFTALADVIVRRRTDLPPAPSADTEIAVVALIRRSAVEATSDAAVDAGAEPGAGVTTRALRLAWISLYLDDASDLAQRVAGPAVALRSPAAPPEPDGAVSRSNRAAVTTPA
ncbi:FUSC family protein [Nakamurella leprariae]|uniref:FUSC family protein n=1 Tax=Nakamurella leprariae TaxID=2803911 RepID=A0A938YCE4_9ACTN|nr:FUSC family protein [Nakamurella leprariae]MBM9465907.1 FUSC family protein [Nakamurella leprariae]